MSEMGHAMMGSGVARGEERAEEAAEAAISSPLLEDIDLAGARGVLVNITAGLDMRLDEFETVGNTVKAFASDNATVVIGTSLDPDMSDEFRVTVVATGIGNEKKAEISLVSNSTASTAKPKPIDLTVPTAAASEAKVAQGVHTREELKPKTPEVSNSERAAANVGQNTAPKADKEKETGYLDIPAFLRRQAD